MNFFSNRSKYRNVKTTIDGVKFDSKAESEFYLHLKNHPHLMFERQPKVYLSAARILYKPDFKILYHLKNEIIYVDIKGYRTKDFNLKLRLWKAYKSERLLVIKKSSTWLIDFDRELNNIAQK